MIPPGKKNSSWIETPRLRRFGWLVGLVFAAIGLWGLLHGTGLRTWALALGGSLILAASAAPRILSPLYRGWMAIGRILGEINSRLLLSAIFYLILTPMGLMKRAFGASNRQFAFKTGEASYWVRRKTADPAARLKRQY